MITSRSACGKASAFAAAEVRSRSLSHIKRNSLSKSNEYSIHTDHKLTAHERSGPTDDQRDLLVDILSANATKRDAKQYLSRLKGKSAPSKIEKPNRSPACPSVNLGTLYSPARAIADSPQFIRNSRAAEPERSLQDQLHVSIMSLRDPESISDKLIDGLATTISQLGRLDMHVVLVIAPGRTNLQHSGLLDQAERLVLAINKHSRQGARVINQALILDNAGSARVKMLSSAVYRRPLASGIVSIIPSIAYDGEGKPHIVPMSDTMQALALDLSNQQTPDAVSLDRILFVDPRGGIPSRARRDGAHLFVNLKQEYPAILAELQAADSAKHPTDDHIANLQIANMALSLLPSSSSALIVTPEEAAGSSTRSDDSMHVGAGTRRKKNTLIHNLLTNKPLVSSSLPLTRFAPGTSSTTDNGITLAPTATLLKKGLPLAIIPNDIANGLGWRFPESGRTDLDLENDPRVDLPRLVHLINDSFRRKLDVRAYLDRIAGRVAGLIIAGDYEGCAILTWETASLADGSQSRHPVPYLDKFAVLQSSQGSAGVADIVFQAMVRTCFPTGVCWRSRSNNPVNKWYFERAAGTWKLPETQWTMFWTGEGVVESEARWNDYVSVCRGITPTWLDGKQPD